MHRPHQLTGRVSGCTGSTRARSRSHASADSRYAFVSVEGVGAEPCRVHIIELDPVREVASVDVGQQAGGITFWRMEEPGKGR